MNSDTDRKTIDIKCKVKEGYPPVIISNDMSIQLYVGSKVEKLRVNNLS